MDGVSTEEIKAVMRTMLSAARAQCDWMLVGLPREAKTEGQRALAAKHGTPYEFGQSCINALDMIGVGEAKAAIDKYVDEWNAA